MLVLVLVPVVESCLGLTYVRSRFSRRFIVVGAGLGSAGALLFIYYKL